MAAIRFFKAKDLSGAVVYGSGTIIYGILDAFIEFSQSGYERRTRVDYSTLEEVTDNIEEREKAKAWIKEHYGYEYK